MHNIKPLTDVQKKFINKNFSKMIYSDLAKQLNTTERRVCNYIHKAGLRLSKKEFERRKSIGKFKTGQISWNLGLSLPNVPNSGQFTKGHLPANTLYDGAISLRHNHRRPNELYYYIRLSKAHWKEYHIYLWEKYHGPVLKGMVIRFKNGKRFNRLPVIEDLEMITHQEHMDRNRNYDKDRYAYDKLIASYITRDPELKKEVLKHPELLEAKRMELKLRKEIHATKARRKIAVNA